MTAGAEGSAADPPLGEEPENVYSKTDGEIRELVRNAIACGLDKGTFSMMEKSKDFKQGRWTLPEEALLKRALDAYAGE